jgi:2-keto-4-pentenoate hydratase/2-oxohepta-3-ene-1,7-dioic acid hydratase in catechol pathway
MRTFGIFASKGETVCGEVVGDDVHILKQPYWLSIEETGLTKRIKDLEILPPVAPSKVVAVGLNYADHIAEMKRTPLGTPLIWFKAPSSLLAHNGVIRIAYPDHQTDFETELTIVIGRSGRDIPEDRAHEYIFGYTIGLDISDRDLQKTEKQFSRCKSFDTYTPIGPFVYSGVDVADLPVELRQNGTIRQEARTSQMIYSVPQIVAFASQSLTLLAGDIILTGTPSGVGPIKAGDTLEARISDWPVLSLRVANPS